MDAQRLIVMAIMGIVAGWLASIVVGGPGSLVGYLIAGVLGAFVGSFVFSTFKIKLGVGNAVVDSIIQATVGAIIVIVLASLIR